MKEYIVQKTLDLFNGSIGLTKQQAAARAGKLKKKRKGVYEIIAPVQFKVGEIILLDIIPKALQLKVSEIILQLYLAPGNKDQGSGIKDQGSGIKDQGSGIKDQGSGIKDQGPGIRGQELGTGIMDRG